MVLSQERSFVAKSTNTDSEATSYPEKQRQELNLPYRRNPFTFFAESTSAAAPGQLGRGKSLWRNLYMTSFR